MTTETDRMELVKARGSVLRERVANCELRITLLKNCDLPGALLSEREMLRRLTAELQICESELAGYEDDMSTKTSLKSRIEKVLSRLYPPGTRFPNSHNPLEPEIKELDESDGSARISLGACSYDEGARYGMQIKHYLEKKFPELTSVHISIMEVD